jgi:hypothetical protein
MSREQNNKAVSRRWHEAWGTHAITSAYAECLAPDFTGLQSAVRSSLDKGP